MSQTETLFEEPVAEWSTPGPAFPHPQNPRALPSYRFYRRLRKIVLSLGQFQNAEAVAEYLLPALVEGSQEPGAVFLGGRAYRFEGEYFALFAKAGEAGDVPFGHRVPTHYPVMQKLLREGWALIYPSDPLFDPVIEKPLGGGPFAAIVIGARKECLISFTLAEPVPEEEVIYALLAVRAVADLALDRRELVELMEQAQEVQTSLLPAAPPTIEGYDIAFETRPAVIVGGDLFDFLEFSPSSFGVSIGDAMGHGLPAALQARDAVVGLRMAAAQDLPLEEAMARLARVLRGTSPSSRFLSMFYGELDAAGRIRYSNAGHPAPLLLRAASGHVEQLKAGGPVMGLAIPVAYEQGEAQLEPGDFLVLYTDGLTEARNAAGVEWSCRGLLRAVARRYSPATTAADVVRAVYEGLAEFTEGAVASDDRTLVVLRRRP